MTNETKESPTRVKLGDAVNPVRFSFIRFHEPKQGTDKAGKPRGEPKYGCMVIVPKDGPWKADIDKAMRAAAVDFHGEKKKFETLKNVLRDGDDPAEDEKGEHLKGCWFFNCTSKNKPQVVGTERDVDGKLLRLSKDEIRSGDWGRVSINFYGYDEEGSKGVAAGLGNVQKIEDGEPLGNQRSADDDFDDGEVL